MSLSDWLRNGWLTEHTTSKHEVADLLAVCDRKVGWLADERHPDAGQRILVSAPPERLRLGGREVVIDLARNAPVATLPEEEVRQRVLRHLIDYLGYPPKVLGSEWALRRQSRELSERADILVMWPCEEGGNSLVFAAVV